MLASTVGRDAMIAVTQMSHLGGHLSIMSTLVLLKFVCVLETLGPNTRGDLEAALASIQLMAPLLQLYFFA